MLRQMLPLVHLRPAKVALAQGLRSWQTGRMIRTVLMAALLATGAAGCASTAAYGPASSSGDIGYMVQPIESNRYRVTYTAKSREEARSLALRRAAEVTLENGGDWFRVVDQYAETDRDGGGSSISLGGGTSSRGSGVGVGVGFGIPIGGSSEKTTASLEIVTGTGAKPDDDANAYDAASILANIED